MTAPGDEPLPVVRACDLADADTRARWLVEPLWTRDAAGLLGGSPKTCKSWLALDLAVSVASATPCLGAFAVRDAGPALIYMAEDQASIVKARLAGICAHRGLPLGSLAVDVITAPALRLDQARDQRRLRDAVRARAPRLLVLDPFVRLQAIDENDARQVAALLGYLRTLQRELGTAVLVVHHARKNGVAGQPGQALRGSGDFFAWADALLYMRRHKGALVLSVEHRAAPAPQPVRLALAQHDERTVHLALLGDAPDDDDGGSGELERDIVRALATATDPLSRAELRGALRVRNERLGDALTHLACTGAIVRAGDRWRLPVPVPAP